MRKPTFAIAAVAFASAYLAAPAQAVQMLIVFSGTAFLAPSMSPIDALQPFAGGTVVGGFVVDTAAAGQLLTGPVGGQGEGAFLTGAIVAGQIDLFGFGSTMSLFRNGNDFGNIFTVNDGGVPSNPNNRVDQMAYTTSTALAGGNLRAPYDLAGDLPPDLFFGSLFFGRVLQAPFDNPPQMITDVTTRDFAGVLAGPLGNPVGLSINFRQGDPTINGTLTGLPSQSISVGNLQFSFLNLGGAVPEPSSWAMLIAGFGLVGAALRRRRAAVTA